MKIRRNKKNQRILFGIISFLLIYYLSAIPRELILFPATQKPEWRLSTDNAQFPGRSGHTCIVFNNRLWVIGGWNGKNGMNDVWSSSDGIKWDCATQKAPFTPRAGHSSTVFNGRIWVIGGLCFDRNHNITDLNDIWCSKNGSDWECITPHADFSSRGGHASIVFKDRIWVIGGIACGGDVWYSCNGRRWHCAQKNAAFNSRGGHALLVFNNRMWVIGGMYVDEENSYHSMSDVWSSENGEDWDQVVEETSFFAGGGNASVYYDNRMWVMGGFRKSGTVYASSDGANWNLIEKAASFGERVTHSCVVFNNRIWIIGGYDGSGHMNDVWHSEISPGFRVTADNNLDIQL